MERDLIKFVDSLIGTPYVMNGRDLEGMDCFGIVVYFYRHVLGVEILDSVQEFPAEWYLSQDYIDEKKKLIYERGGLVEDIRPFDLILMGRKTSDEVTHIGVYLGENMVLHTRKATGACLNRLSDIKKLRNYRGTWRFHDR